MLEKLTKQKQRLGMLITGVKEFMCRESFNNILESLGLEEPEGKENNSLVWNKKEIQHSVRIMQFILFRGIFYGYLTSGRSSYEGPIPFPAMFGLCAQRELAQQALAVVPSPLTDRHVTIIIRGTIIMLIEMFAN